MCHTAAAATIKQAELSLLQPDLMFLSGPWLTPPILTHCRRSLSPQRMDTYDTLQLPAGFFSVSLATVTKTFLLLLSGPWRAQTFLVTNIWNDTHHAIVSPGLSLPGHRHTGVWQLLNANFIGCCVRTSQLTQLLPIVPGHPSHCTAPG